MATHSIGKLRFNISDQGLAFHIGDGKIHRIPFKSSAAQSTVNDYDDRYADEAGDEYYEDNLPENGADDSYYEDDYADDGYYAGAGYSEDDSRYDVGGYNPEEEEGGYDDRYSDADADDYPQDDIRQNSLDQYIADNSWVVFALLVIFPPLGIFLLWRYQKLAPIPRLIASVVSALWCAFLIILLCGGFKGKTDAVNTPVATETPELTLAPTEAIQLNTVAPDETDKTSAADDFADANQQDYVFSPVADTYYHASETCSGIAAGVSISKVSKEIAENSRSQTACPICYPQEDVEIGNNDTPVEEVDTSFKMVFIKSNTKDKSGIKVYATQGGTYFHMTSGCSGMKNAAHISLKSAIMASKEPCPTCCSVAVTKVYCTEGGTYYHVKSGCSGMENARKVTLAEALILGKKRCPKCVTSSLTKSSAVEGTIQYASVSAGDGKVMPVSTSETVCVYGTKNGKYYHTVSDCSGMENAQKVTLANMVAIKRTPCPVCCSFADQNVYVQNGQIFYHSYHGCSGMTNALNCPLTDALINGYTKCPVCWSGAGSETVTVSGTVSYASIPGPIRRDFC